MAPEILAVHHHVRRAENTGFRRLLAFGEARIGRGGIAGRCFDIRGVYVGRGCDFASAFRP